MLNVLETVIINNNIINYYIQTINKKYTKHMINIQLKKTMLHFYKINND